MLKELYKAVNDSGKLVLNTIESLAGSQGMYGRMLYSICENAQDSFDAVVDALNDLGDGCTDAVSVVMKIEC